MKCGHTVMDYKLEKNDGIVFIQYACEKGCKTEWASVGEAPHFDSLLICHESEMK